MPDFVTIATYDDYVIANLDLQLLRENEIHSYLADEHYIAWRWTSMQALGGLKLRVSTDQADEARALLQGETEELQVDFTVENPRAAHICPSCGSNNTGADPLIRTFAGLCWFVLCLPLPWIPKRSYRCYFCAHRWKA
jgi:hypothetical protein